MLYGMYLTQSATMSDAVALALSRAIRAERARAGLSQDAFGRRMGWSRATVSHVETLVRRVQADELPDLCGALGVTFAELFAKVPAEDRAKLGLMRTT